MLKISVIVFLNSASIVGSKLILDYYYFMVNHMRDKTKAILEFLIFINWLPMFKFKNI